MTQTLCSVCLPESASCESMSFFFVSSLKAEQSSMINNVGLPANLSKEQTQQFLKFFCPVRQHGIYYSYVFLFWAAHITNPAPVFVGLVPLYGGAKYDYIFEHTLIFFFQANRGQTRSYQSSSDHILWLNVDTLETQYLISLNLLSSKLICASCIINR